jgi:hypothetical protein
VQPQQVRKQARCHLAVRDRDRPTSHTLLSRRRYSWQQHVIEWFAGCRCDRGLIEDCTNRLGYATTLRFFIVSVKILFPTRRHARGYITLYLSGYPNLGRLGKVFLPIVFVSRRSALCSPRAHPRSFLEYCVQPVHGPTPATLDLRGAVSGGRWVSTVLFPGHQP